MKSRFQPIAALCIGWSLLACDRQETHTTDHENDPPAQKAPATRPARIRAVAEKKQDQENLVSALQIEAPEERQKAIAEIAWNSLETDPQLADDALAKLTTDSEDRLQLIEHFAMTKASENPEAAMAWARSLESDLEISTALGQIALVIADTDPHRAAQLLSDSGMEGRQFDVAVVQVLERWAEQDPLQATDWVMSFPPGETRQAGLSATFSAWADRDTSKALSWMATVESSDLRQEVARAMAEALVLHDAESRETWLTQADPKVRAEIEAKLPEALKNVESEPDNADGSEIGEDILENPPEEGEFSDENR